MPGKTSQSQSSNRGKDPKDSRDRLNSANQSELLIKIWPEWSEAELAAEKWDVGGVGGVGGGGGGGGGKSRDKGKISHGVTVYEDHDGILLPPSIAGSGVIHWNRAIDEPSSDSMPNSVPVIVNDPDSNVLDLYTSNKHLLHSQLMLWIIGQLNILWQMRHSIPVDTGCSVDWEHKEGTRVWRPWEHIHPFQKGTPPAPLCNPMGKYCVRIYWMGCWRKVTVDDKLPFLEQCTVSRNDESEKNEAGECEVVKEEEVSLLPLYPRTSNSLELWPAILTKAILKVAALDYSGGCPYDEFGDSSVIHMLTGWTPQTISLKSCQPSDVWKILTGLLPLWVRREVDEEEETESSTKGELEEENKKKEKEKTDSLPLQEEKESRQDYIVIGSFSSCFPGITMKPFTMAFTDEVSKAEALLKIFHIIPSDYDLGTQPSYPVLLTQVRDIPLIPPPKEPPLPILQAPYYLGLIHRERHPGLPTPPPTPPPVEPRFVELIPAPFTGVDIDPLTPNVIIGTTSPEISDREVASEGDSKGECISKPHPSMDEIDNMQSKHSQVEIDNMQSKHSKVEIDNMQSKHSKVDDMQSKHSKVDNMQSKHSKVPSEESILNERIYPKWMDYLEFFTAFKNIHIFKNPSKFKHRETYSDLSKTSGNSGPTSAASVSKKGTSVSHLNSSSKYTGVYHFKDRNYLFIDSVDPVDLQFVFTSLSNWREGGKDTKIHPSSSTNIVPTLQFDQAAVSPSVSYAPLSVTEQQQKQVAELMPAIDKSELSVPSCGEVKRVLPGSLVMETYSWKTVQFGEPVLRISTTGTKGTILSLPPGLQVFKLLVNVPIGHHLEVFSQSQFFLLNEDSVFSHLSQDSNRFVSFGASIVQNLLLSSKFCGQLQALDYSLQPLLKLLSKCDITAGYTKLLLSSALYSWSTHARDCGLTPKMQTTWKAFLYKAFNIIEDRLPPGTTYVSSDISALRNSLNVYYTKNEDKPSPSIPEMWIDRNPTPEEEQASKLISQHIRLYAQSRLEDIMVPGTQSNNEASEILAASVDQLKPHIPTLGATILHGLLKLDSLMLDSSILDKLPFSKDIAAQAYSTLHHGSFQTNSWTVIFQKTMYISEPQHIAFIFHCPLQTSLLRVINNDTMTEVPRVFQSTIPQIYQPNEKGYTIQAEAWVVGVVSDEAEDKKFKLRIVTSHRDRPPLVEGCSKEEGKVVDETFHKQEFINYCLPDREDILFRYHLIAIKECQLSIQTTFSRRDALIRLEILDYENSLVAVEGRDTCIIPLFTLQPSNLSPVKDDSIDEATQDQSEPVRKYVVQARILRKSWPLADTAWPYIATIYANEERPASNKPGSARKSVRIKEKKTKSSASSSNTQIPQMMDNTKPHWVLRIVTREMEEFLEVKKDTEKIDRLKNMVHVWDVEQPGRSKKAQESRQKFLAARAIKDESTKEEEVKETGDRDTHIPKPNTGPVKLWQMDLTPFTIKESVIPKLLDEKEQAQRSAERQNLFKEYRSARQMVLQLRNEDREQRNEAKIKQLELAEEWQFELDALRNKLNSVRETIRERQLAIEKAETEKLKVAEEAQEGRDSKASKGKGGKKKK